MDNNELGRFGDADRAFVPDGIEPVPVSPLRASIPSVDPILLDWLRRHGGGAAMHLTLASGLPGGTRTERVKARGFAEGFSKAVVVIRDAIERGDPWIEAARMDEPL